MLILRVVTLKIVFKNHINFLLFLLTSYTMKISAFFSSHDTRVFNYVVVPFKPGFL